MNRFLSLIGFLALVGSISCIDYVSITNGSVTFPDARQGCEDIGMKLYEPITEAKNKALMEFLKANAISSVWIGGHRGSADKFKWLHDTNPMAYTDFVRGRPLASGSKRDCLHMHWDEKKDNFGWLDSDCNDVHRYVCMKAQNEAETHKFKNSEVKAQKETEKPKNKNSERPGPVPPRPSYTVVGGRCVYIFGRGTFSQGLQTCHERGMRMVKPSDWYANEDLHKVILNSGMESVYLGAMKDQYGMFHWTDNAHPMHFNNFGPGVPHDRSEGRDCLAMYRDGKWYDRVCAESHMIICQSVCANA